MLLKFQKFYPLFKTCRILSYSVSPALYSFSHVIERYFYAYIAHPLPETSTYLKQKMIIIPLTKLLRDLEQMAIKIMALGQRK